MKIPFLIVAHNMDESGKLPVIVWAEKFEEYGAQLFEIGKALVAAGVGPDGFEEDVRDLLEEGMSLRDAVEQVNYDLLGNGDLQINEVSVDLFNKQKSQLFTYE